MKKNPTDNPRDGVRQGTNRKRLLYETFHTHLARAACSVDIGTSLNNEYCELAYIWRSSTRAACEFVLAAAYSVLGSIFARAFPIF